MSETPIRRDFPVTLTRSGTDERTLGGCCVPYNTPATVSDDGITSYREMFVPGAFSRQLNAANRVKLTYSHRDDHLSIVGRGVSLEERADGLWGMFRMLEGMPGDHALTLVDEGMLTGLSIEGVSQRHTRNHEGVVVRSRVDLKAVSLCEQPAYADALVSMRRSWVDVERPPRPNDDQMRRLAAVGVCLDDKRVMSEEGR